MIAKAKNGSGKSLALTILLINNVLQSNAPMSTQAEQLQEESSGHQNEAIEIRGLVLAPTREIAIQLHDYFN